MSKKKVLLVAGALVAAGTVAALAAVPHFRGHHRMGMGFEGGHRDGGARFAERLKEMDANKDGVITLEEFLGRRDAGFARLDKTGDGFVDASDMAARAQEGTEYRVKRFLKMFDTNRDGKVTKEEFEQRAKDRFAMRDLNSDGEIGLDDLAPDALACATAQAAGRKAPKEARRAPRSRSPAASRLTACLAARTAVSRASTRTATAWSTPRTIETAASERVDFATKRFMKRFDANGDGKVSKDEFERFAKERFTMLDLDDDGKITEADLPPRMRGRGILK